MNDLQAEEELGLRVAAPERVPGCAGGGRCHGSRVWCEVCGDTKRVCDAPERCERHRPWSDAQIDAAIHYWLLERGVRLLKDLVAVVSDDPDLPLSPTADRVRERLILLMVASKIIVRLGGVANWVGLDVASDMRV